MNVPHSLGDEMVREIKARGIYVCPTLSGSAYSVVKFLRDPGPPVSGPRPGGEAGVRLIFGTDTPFAFGNFFHSVMNEVRALKLSGLSNDSILRMATSEAASVLGLSDRIGTIAPGKVADVVLVDGDPLSDIEALGRVALVVKEGRVVYRK